MLDRKDYWVLSGVEDYMSNDGEWGIVSPPLIPLAQLWGDDQQFTEENTVF